MTTAARGGEERATRRPSRATLAAREQLASNQSLTAGRLGRAASERAARRGARARGLPGAARAPSCVAPVDGYVARRSVQLGQRVQAGAPLMSVVPLEPGLGRRQLQGKPAAQPAHRPAGRRSRPTSTAARSTTTARSKGSAPAPARRSRCCRRRTRPATGSRSCSACRCASRSTRRKSPRIRCASACRWTRRSTSRNTDGRMLADARSAAPRRRPRVFDQASQQADAEVQQHHRRQPRPRGQGAGVPTAGADPRRARRARPRRRRRAAAARRRRAGRGARR